MRAAETANLQAAPIIQARSQLRKARLSQTAPQALTNQMIQTVLLKTRAALLTAPQVQAGTQIQHQKAAPQAALNHNIFILSGIYFPDFTEFA